MANCPNMAQTASAVETHTRPLSGTNSLVNAASSAITPPLLLACPVIVFQAGVAKQDSYLPCPAAKRQPPIAHKIMTPQRAS